MWGASYGAWVWFEGEGAFTLPRHVTRSLHGGHMFKPWFTMHRTCPNCGLEFERASGRKRGVGD